MKLWKIQRMVFEEYKKNGYLEEWTNPDILTQAKIDIAELGLVVTEISEAMEECRNIDNQKLGYELADIIIRVLNFASRKSIDIQSHVIAKHQMNLKRGKLHGRQI